MLQERTRNLMLKVSDEELAKVHRIASAQDQEVARVVRAWIHSEYASRFGIEKPPAPNSKRGRPRKAA